MRKRKAIATPTRIVLLALCLASLSCVASPAAWANSLLGGYGGPGEGNQAILGSTVVAAPAHRGGGASGTSATPASTGQESQEGTAGAGATSGFGGSSGGGGGTGGAAGKGSATRASAGSGKGRRRAAGGSSKRAPQGSQAGGSPRATPQLTNYPTKVVGSQALGLSIVDLLYILLGAAALGVTAFVTRRLSHPPEGQGVR
jgi:hypothetical protein